MTQYRQTTTPPSDTPGVASEPQYYKVSFKGNRRETYLNTENLQLNAGAYVVVETEMGEDLGILSPVCSKGGCCSRGPSSEPAYTNRKNGEKMLRVLREASEAEINQHHNNRRDEPDAFKKALELIKKNRLKMKLVDVEYQLDRKKMTFFYTAEDRVDFRQLVKDLAFAFRTRIEMRQIGVRDHARRLDGLGPCGQQLCCSRFMDGFEPVTTQYAKDQNLPINPSKLSGACGKLKCCLCFEWDFYRESQKEFPSTGIPIQSEQGLGTLVANDILNKRCTVAYEDGRTEVFSLPDIQKLLQAMDTDIKERKHQA